MRCQACQEYANGGNPYSCGVRADYSALKETAVAADSLPASPKLPAPPGLVLSPAEPLDAPAAGTEVSTSWLAALELALVLVLGLALDVAPTCLPRPDRPWLRALPDLTWCFVRSPERPSPESSPRPSGLLS